MACQVPPLDTLTNNQTFINTSQLAQTAAAEIAFQLGIALTVGDTIIPLAPFIWTAIAIEVILGMFGGGRPKDEDTNNVIWAYHMSAYWPLQQLGTNLAMALKNGAPISDSRPAIQAQFSAWKQGTIESIQQLAGWPPGPGSPGYWQLQELINTSWAYSKGGQQVVLNVVRAIDCFTEVLTQLPKPSPPPPPPPPGGGGGSNGGGGIPCDSGNPDQDEILDLCQALKSALGNVSGGGGVGGVSDTCCSTIALKLSHIVAELTVIATAVSNPPGPPPPIDLGPIVIALSELVTAVSAIQLGPPVDLAPLVDAVNQVATAVANSPGTDVSGIVKALQPLSDDETRGKALAQYWNSLGIGDPQATQILLS